MTIKPDEPWGRVVARPRGLVDAHSDAELASLLAVPGDRTCPGVIARGGDLAKTLGAPTVDRRTTVNELPVDLVEVRAGAATVTACAHVVIRSPWWRGGWWRGPIVLVMNAEFIDEWDVAPRGHPNDGRLEVFEVDATFGVRQRVEALRRLPAATHVPHPAITTRSIRSATWNFTRPMTVVVDGRRQPTARAVSVTVVADAATVYA
jgi:hypothetical protein